MINISLFYIKFIEFYVSKKDSMPIKSYLVHPYENKRELLIAALKKIKECEVIPATNDDVLVLVTDTADEASEEKLKEKIEKIKSLKLLAMVSGFTTPQNQ